jgi:hypothetical protein
MVSVERGSHKRRMRRAQTESQKETSSKGDGKGGVHLIYSVVTPPWGAKDAGEHPGFGTGALRVPCAPPRLLAGNLLCVLPAGGVRGGFAAVYARVLGVPHCRNLPQTKLLKTL